jgi:hypothetical protein
VRLPFRNELIAVALSACALACSSDPDVLASAKDTNSFLEGGPLDVCRAGDYTGAFTTDPTWDSGAPFDVNGTLTFSLGVTTNEKGGEVVEVGPNARLEGDSNTPFQGAKVSATLHATDPCQGGHIKTEFQEGYYSVPGAGALPFTGTTLGVYTANVQNDTGQFAGTWDAFVGLGSQPIHLTGIWYAFWRPPPTP